MDSIRTGALISALRRERGLTQKELAALLGVSDKAVSKWERGECFPDITLLIWDRVDRYSPARGSLRAWLTALARNAALNRLRALRRRGTEDELHPELADPAPGPEETVLRREQSGGRSVGLNHAASVVSLLGVNAPPFQSHRKKSLSTP